MFQAHPLAGCCILVGIGINDVGMLLGCLLAIFTAIGLARWAGYPTEEIAEGLYGFNAALVGIAVVLFYGWSVASAAILVVGAVISTLLRHFFRQRGWPGYTFPFILTVWGIYLLASFVGLAQTASSPTSEAASLDLGAAFSFGIGQVMFQGKSLWAGLFFFVGILIGNRVHALYTLWGIALSLLVCLWPHASLAAVNEGLHGYNPVLCAIALGGLSTGGFIRATGASLLAIALQLIGMQAGVLTLTAPFVFAVWVVLAVEKWCCRK